MKIQKALEKTGRKLYIDVEILKSAPIYTKAGEVEFFKLNKYISNNDLEKEYGSRGLIPADIVSLCKVSQDTLDEKKYVGTHWKDSNGRWCYAAFFRWFDGREVVVNRGGDGWHGRWWFAGLRKLSTQSSEPKNSSVPLNLDLESAIKLVKKEGYKIFKEV